MKNVQKMLFAVLTAAVFMVASPASAASDPISGFFEGLFGGHVRQVTYHPVKSRHMVRGYPSHRGYTNSGGTGGTVLTSYYGHGEKLSSHTASGERFNPYAMTAAHRSLPIGSHLLVSHGGRSVVVRINDRGPAAYTGRSLDLSYGAARVLGITGRGVAPVQIARLD